MTEIFCTAFQSDLVRSHRDHLWSLDKTSCTQFFHPPFFSSHWSILTSRDQILASHWLDLTHSYFQVVIIPIISVGQDIVLGQSSKQNTKIGFQHTNSPFIVINLNERFVIRN